MPPTGLSVLDYAAFGWLIACWGGYSLVADHGPWRKRTVSAVMGGYRARWMKVMLQRENRIVDTNIIGNLLNGVAFFASTTIFAIGGLLAALGASDIAVALLRDLPFADESGLLAALGASDIAVALLRDLPFADETSRTEVELKILLLIVILAFSFFKFAWAYRLFNHCSVLIGATPIEADEDPAAARLADRAARVNVLAASHFNRGLRAYFFALAVIAWLVHPLLFMGASAWVAFVIYRREFHSRSLRILLEQD